jgi:hypothetical protein
MLQRERGEYLKERRPFQETFIFSTGLSASSVVAIYDDDRESGRIARGNTKGSNG